MEPERNNPNRKPPENPNGEDNKPRTNGWVALTIAILVVLAFSTIFNAVSNSQYTQTTWSDFRDAVESGNLSEVEIRHDRVVYMTREEADKDPREQRACFTGLPATYDQMTLANELDAMGVKVDKLIVEDNSAIIMILYYAGMLLLTFFMIRMLMKRMGDGGMGSFGKSKAKVYMEKDTGVRFTDVADGFDADAFQQFVQNGRMRKCAVGQRFPLLPQALLQGRLVLVGGFFHAHGNTRSFHRCSLLCHHCSKKTASSQEEADEKQRRSEKSGGKSGKKVRASALTFQNF